MKILFITSNRLGDAVLSTGLLNHLISKHRGARVTVACGPITAPLFVGMAGVEHVIALTKKPYSRHWFSLWRQVAGQVWDLVVDLRSSAIGWTLIAKRRRRLVKSDANVHRLRLLADVLSLPEIPAPGITVPSEAQAQAKALIPDAGILAIGPTANWGGKQWPAELFAELINRLTGSSGPFEGRGVAVFGAESEREVAQPVLDSIPDGRGIDIVGRVDLPAIHACLGRCGLYVGNDSGLMHLAAAAGTPTLGLFGPSREVHYSPWGKYTTFVRTPESYEQILYAPGYDFRSQKSLMGSLTVDAVATAALGLIAEVEMGAP